MALETEDWSGELLHFLRYYYWPYKLLMSYMEVKMFAFRPFWCIGERSFLIVGRRIFVGSKFSVENGTTRQEAGPGFSQYYI